MGTTTNFDLPYPESSSTPNGPAQIKALAEAVDNLLIPLDAPAEFASNLEVVGNLGVQGDTFVEALEATSVTTTNLEATNVTVGSQDWTGEWMDFDPNWTSASGASPDIGNGTLTARYMQLGKTVFFNIYLAGGSTTVWGGGFWQFSLPVQANNSFTAACSYRDNSIPLNVAGSADIRNNPGGTNAIIRSNVPTGAAVSNTIPFTWATADTYKVTGVYEAA
ncbi:hypothetical protein ITP53_26035 [Nonomuraea sp. K274]|uniref:Uncharacterized protein n=1 Tax=Nonomuraea cypriaca TaxID=1187855 RepID=A0A931ADK4_9ACTN|nr:hypothetical protein [Nonomuraea cypriaca]MBF8189129.1 hypothetical protein [Nonomuraea cypriaca]